MPESNMCDDNDTSSLARPSGSVRAAPTAPLVFREKQRVKGKSTVTSKVSSGTHIRKPLTLSDFPVLSRSSHKGGSSKSVPTQVVSLDASKHSVVVIGENSYSNIQQPMQQFFDPPPLQQHLLGDPHDCSPGVGEIPDSTAVRTNPLDVYVAADDHSHERGGDHAGDRNTRYFHRRAVNRKQRNKITTLKLPDGTWCDDVSTLQDEATRYFASLFSKDIAPQDPFPSEYSFPMIHDSHLCHLDDLSSNDEIHAALSEMAPLKSSGWDGYTPSSFKVNGML
ncbi:hypothetical protein V6N12_073685 [Hibiscus sabdariffa]|uniref:Uncharacterized protein n=1 Tax=Hibiscus sabdariffa TaxID=183260 RepID=A0ABR2CTM8_9ROSI